METKLENGKLRIRLPERITSTNAQDVQNETKRILNESATKSFQLDAADMSYISSAGLRVLLAFTKAGYDFEIINVLPSAYDVFDVTGFSKLLKIKKAYREMSIEGLPVIGIGATSKVYRVDKDTILKVFSPDRPLELIEKEIQHAKDAFLMGVTTAISYDIVKVGDSFGTVFELLNSKTLSEMLQEYPEREEELITNYARFMKNMHKVTLPKEEFGSEKDLLLEMLRKYSDKCTEEEYHMMSDVITAIPDRSTFVHGDFHPKNVMLQDGEPILIDMYEASCAHPIFDIMSLGVLRILSDVVPDAMALNLAGMTCEQARKVWDKFLRVYFETEDEGRLKEINTVTLCYSAIRAWRICVMIPAFPPQLAAYSMGVFKKLYAAGGTDLDLLGL